MSRVHFTYRQNIPVTDLLLDTENARIRVGSDQNDCMTRILRKEAQLLALMRDIAEKGLTTMPILVSPASGNKWIVKDGNRRVTALKLLNDPDCCPIGELKGRILAIKEKFNDNIFDVVDVLSSDNEEAIVREVVARHSGSMGGAGQLDWNAYLRTIYLLGHNQPSEYKRAGQYLFWAESVGIYVDDEFPISTLSRFFSEENLSKLGFSVENDKLVSNISIDKLKRIATRIVMDFNPPARLTVDAVRSPEDASAYIEKLRNEVGLAEQKPGDESIEGSNYPGSEERKEAPDVDDGNSNTLGSDDKNDPSGKGSKPGSKGGKPSGPTGPSKPLWDRPGLFRSGKSGFNIPKEYIKITNIVAELKALNLVASSTKKPTPMAVAMLFRALIEMSTKYYMQANGLKMVERLHSDIARAADHMKEVGRLNEEQHAVLIQRTRDEAGMLHVRTLQAYVHSDAFHPNQQVLNTLWDEIGVFVIACWN